MNGAQDLVNLLVSRLAAQVDGRVQTLTGTLAASTYTVANGVTSKPIAVPPVALIQAPTQGQIDAYPCLQIEPGPAGDVTGIEIVNGGVSWRIRYTPRVFIWVRGDNYDDTNAVVLLLTHAVKQTVLDDASLGTAAGVWSVSADIGSWRESPVLVRLPSGDDRGLLGRWVEFGVDVPESSSPLAAEFAPLPAPPHTVHETVAPLHPSLAEIGASS